MQPDLALLYNSRAGNGDLGVGWSLSGLSIITRCGSTPQYDSQWLGPNLTQTDRFCLDGQRLLAMQPNSENHYWAASGAFEYRTAFATFQRIVAVGAAGKGPASFTVYDKTAMTRTYGNPTVELGGDGQTVVMWPVNRIQDPYGNYIEYVYTLNASNNAEYLLKEIDYGSSAGQVGKVVFNYKQLNVGVASGTDSGFAYEYHVTAATGIYSSSLLQTVQVYGPANTLVRQYSLGYQASPRSGRYLLGTVSECDPSNNCVAPTTFTWTGTTAPAPAVNFDEPAVNTEASGSWKAVDLDGDGLLDYVFVNTSNTISVILGKDPSTTINTNIPAGDLQFNYAVVADFQGTGTQELLVPWVTGNSNCSETPSYYLMYVWQNGTLVQVPNYKLIGPGSAVPNQQRKNLPMVFDADGDGLPDMLTKQANCGASGETLWYWHNNGNGWDAPVTTGIAVGDLDNAPVPMNFSGKGYGEFFVGSCSDSEANCMAGGEYYWDNVNQKPVLATGSTTFTADSPDTPILLDLNGDGLTDVAVPNQSTGQWCFFVNQQSSWSPTPSSLGQVCITFDTSLAGAALPLDYYGDGRQELMVPHAISSTQTDWFVIRLNPSAGGPITPVDTGIAYSANTLPFFADANGDGQPDYITQDGFSITVAYNINSSPELISQIQTSNAQSVSLGPTTIVHYLSLPLANASGWTTGATPNLDSGAGAPRYRPFMAPIPLVVEYLVDSGAGTGSNTQWLYTYYRYGGAAMDTWGRGFLGFSDVQSINANAGLLTENTFYQGQYTDGMIFTSSQGAVTPGVTIPNPLTITSTMTCTQEKVDGGTGEVHVCSGTQSGYQGFNSASFGTPSPLAKTENDTPQTLNLPMGGTFSYAGTSTTWSYEPNATTYYKTVTTSPTYQVDASGNNAEATEIKVETVTDKGDDYLVDTSEIQYLDDATNWCLGRVKSSTVVDTWKTAGASPIQVLSASPAHAATFHYSNCALSEEDSSVIDASGNPLSTLTKTYTPDAYGNIATTTVTGVNSDGTALPSRSNSSQYDMYGLYPLTSTNALLQTSSSTWDYRFGLATSSTDPNGVTTSTTYDTFGRKATAQGALPAQQSSWSYDWCGVSASCNSPNAVYAYTQFVNSEAQPGTLIPSSVTEYDRMGRAVFTTHIGLYGTPDYQATYYDYLGHAYLGSQPYQSGDPVCWDYKTFDVLSRVTVDYQPASTTECSNQGSAVIAAGSSAPKYTRNTTYTYAGSTTTVTYGAEITSTTLNGVGKVAVFTDANGKSAEYGYDAWGNTSEVQDATGSNRTSITSDSAGDKLSMTDPDMGAWSYSYDALGELITQLDPNEVVNKQAPTTLKYDALGRVIQRVEPEDTSTWVYDIGYGAGIGKLAYKTMLDPTTGAVTYSEIYAYDGIGHDTDDVTLVNSQEYWVSTTYDDFGQVAQVVYPNLTAVNTNGTPSGFSSGATLALAMDANHTMVQASWPTGSDGAIYELFRASGAGAAQSTASEIYAGPDSSFNDTGVQDGAYTYFVEACYGANCSSALSGSITVALAPPVPPAPTVGLADTSAPDCLAQADTNQQGITVCWPVTNPGSNHYQLRESFNGGAYSGVIWDGRASSSSATTVVAPVTVNQDGTYQFEVVACDSTDTICSTPGPASSPYQTYLTPGAPQSIGASQSTFTGPPATYTIHWTAPTVSGGSVVYQLFETFSVTGAQKQITLSNPSATTSPNITQTVTGTYTYQLQACDKTEPTVCGPFISGAAVTINNPSPPAVPTVTAPTSVEDPNAFTVSWSDTTSTVNSYTLYVYWFDTETYKGLLETFSGNGSYKSQSITMGNEYKSMSFFVIACTATGGCSTSSTVTVTNPDNTAGGGNCPHCLVEPDPDYNGGWEGNIFSSNQPLPQAAISGLMASAAPIPRLRIGRLDSSARGYAPMPGRIKIDRRVVKAYEPTSRIAAVNPRISAYPPLRHDKRIWSHYAAAGGIRSGWAEHAGCDDSSGCSETTGGYALMVGYSYDAYGHQVSVTRLDESGNPQYNYWLALNANARGAITQEGLQLDADDLTMGIGVTRNYDLATGVVTCIDATTKSPQTSCGSPSGALQSDGYAWDIYGNLTNRSSAVTGLNETFGYDPDNRLDSISTLYNGTQVASDAPSYEDTQGRTPGNISQRNGATYSYPSPGSPLPHAVAMMTLPGGVTRNFGYDLDGNLVTETGDVTRNLTWYSYNKPQSITSNGAQESFLYGPDHDRYQRVSQANGDTVTTVYIDGLFEVQSDGNTGVTTYRHYVMASGEMVAVDTFQGTSGSSASETVSYYLHDHLGEVEATVNGNGQNLVQFSYDAWGKARPTSGATAFVTPAWGGCLPTLPGQHTGFGVHENLDDECLVHMEGRVYDPEMGRFLSADPTMQYPISTQGYDRYAYIGNNPVSGTDPNGYHFYDIAGPVSAILYAAGEDTECSVFCEGAAYAIAAVDGYQQNGFKGALIQAGEMYASNYVSSNYGTNPFEEVVLSGLVGGVFTQLSGGDFGDGFLTAAASSAGGYFINGTPKGFSQVTESIVESYVVGGTVSVIGGGNYANGAKTMGFYMLFKSLPELYREFVGYPLDPTPGGPAVGKAPTQRPVQGANNVGSQYPVLDPTCIWCEGGNISRALNEVPLINAIAGVHDTFQINLGDGLLRDILNVPGMLIAAPFTIAAFISEPLSFFNPTAALYYYATPPGLRQH